MDVRKYPPVRLTAAGGAALASLLCVALLSVPAAHAQFGDVRSAERLETGQVTNLFASWTGRDVIQGVVVELPAGWTLREARILRYGYEPVAAQVERDGPRYVVSAVRPLQGPHELVLRVQVGDVPGWAEWAVVPFARAGNPRASLREAYRAGRGIRLDYPEPPTDNRVMSFADPGRRGEEGAPLLLRQSALPDLGTRAAYTVAFWMKTDRLDQIMLSTWDGDERAAYPLELVVDRSGRLLAYRGQPGRHQSMRSRLPVADSRWHHVAFTNDPESGWARLYLDGFAVDSLYSAVPAPIDARTPLAVGGRVPAKTGGPARSFYTGLIDELSVLAGVRTAATIRSAMRQPAGSGRANGRRGVRLGFEEPVEAALVERRSPRTQRVASDLSFYLPIRNLRAEVADRAVRLSWDAPGPEAAAFVVERSPDGRRFEEVGRLAPADAERGAYRFLDQSVPGQVLFYRVRQVFAGGSERVSSTIKLGLGPSELPATASLVGNFPNPFNATTTITYEVLEAQQVRVSVWDLSGQQVRMLVSQVQPPGAYEVTFQADDLPSGTYFVRLETSGGVQSHQMILMK